MSWEFKKNILVCHGFQILAKFLFKKSYWNYFLISIRFHSSEKCFSNSWFGWLFLMVFNLFASNRPSHFYLSWCCDRPFLRKYFRVTFSNRNFAVVNIITWWWWRRARIYLNISQITFSKWCDFSAKHQKEKSMALHDSRRVLETYFGLNLCHEKISKTFVLLTHSVRGREEAYVRHFCVCLSSKTIS